jgi:hypothetical protein
LSITAKINTNKLIQQQEIHAIRIITGPTMPIITLFYLSKRTVIISISQPKPTTNPTL